MKKEKSNQKGFTVIELLTVVVIIGIVATIGAVNLLAAQNRAKIAELKTNMHSVKYTIEVYAIDWSGKYPTSIQAVKQEGIKNNYWKVYENPFNGNLEQFKNSITSVTSKGNINPNNFPKGSMGYLVNNNNYGLYGAQENGQSIIDKGDAFFLSNN